MGSVCSRESSTHTGEKKGKDIALDKTDNLDRTLHDDIRGRKSLQHSHKNIMSEHEDTVIVSKADSKADVNISDEDDDLEVISPSTLDNDSSLREKVKLPSDIQLEQWVFVNLMSFVESITMLYDSVSDVCTPEICKEMTAGPHYTYFWTDFQGQNPTAMCANEYITTLFQYISDLFNREPYKECKNALFPEDFMQTSRAIFKKLFRVYSHVYHHHLSEFTKMGAEAHLNTTFKHFVLFEREFKLINMKEELPLRKLIQKLVEEEEENPQDDLRNIMSRGINSISYRRNSPQTDSSE